MIKIFKSSKKAFGAEEIFLVLALLLLIVYIGFIIYFPTFKDWSRTLWEQALEIGRNNGYWGSFVFSFLAHTTIIIPVPYTILLVYLGSTGLSIIGLALAAGIGSSIGELTSYITGLIGGAIVWKKYHDHFVSLKKILNKKPRLMPWIIFIFGVSPLPDDVLLIPLGMIRYNFFKAVIPMAIGKIVLTGLFAWTGRAVSPTIESFVYQPGIPWPSIVTLLSVIIFIYIIIKIDWQSLGKIILGENGNKEGLKTD